MSDTALAPDAAIALGIAATAMPFARTSEEEAERWLRILRLHGDAGGALQAVGVSEGRLEETSREDFEPRPVESPERTDPVSRVGDEAVEIAARRGRVGVTTTDLLLAVLCVYGEDFDRVLAAHGSDRDELLRRLDVTLPVSELCGS